MGTRITPNTDTFYAVQLDKSQKEYMLSMVLGFPGDIS